MGGDSRRHVKKFQCYQLKVNVMPSLPAYDDSSDSDVDEQLEAQLASEESKAEFTFISHAKGSRAPRKAALLAQKAIAAEIKIWNKEEANERKKRG
jgi:hypothetical protein